MATGPGLDVGAIRTFPIAPALRHVLSAKVALDVAGYRSAHGDPLTLRGVTLVTFMRALMALPDAFSPYPAVLAAGEALAGRPSPPRRKPVCSRISCPSMAASKSRCPHSRWRPGRCRRSSPPTPLNVALAARRGLVATARQTSIRLNSAEQTACGLLSRPYPFDLLRAAAAGKAMGSSLRPFLQTLAAAGCLLV